MNKFDPTKPVRCRDMSDIAKAEIVRTDMGGVCPILTVITYGDGTKNHARHTADGHFYEGREHALDLINIPEKRKEGEGLEGGEPKKARELDQTKS